MRWSHPLPPDNRAYGSGDPPNDADAFAEALSAQGAAFNVQNPVFAGGADPTGSSDSSPAFSAAIGTLNGLPGQVLVPPGTYKAASPLAQSMTSGQYLRGAGRWATTLLFNGTGDCIRAVDSSAYLTRTVHGGGVTGMTINGAGAGASSDAIHIGDIFQWEIDVAVENFSQAGSTGVFLDNQNFWTEQLHGRIFAQDCVTAVAFSCGGALTSTGSFDRMTLDVFLNLFAGQVGVSFGSGAFAFGRLGIYGNLSPGAGGAVLQMFGQSPAGHPASFSGLGNTGEGPIVLHIDVECDGTAASPPQSVFFGGASNALVGVGALNFIPASAAFAASNNAGQFQFEGPVTGDASLPSLRRTGSTVQAVTANGQALTWRGATLRVTSTGAFTGLIVAAGAFDGQELRIVNESANALTMAAAATSNVASGVSCVVPALRSAALTWDAATSLWYQA